MINLKSRTTVILFSITTVLLFVLLAALWGSDGYAKEIATPQAAIYYVAPGGKDSNPGTMNLPWRTIQKAANTLAAGDTVYIRGGTYYEQVVPQNSGCIGKYITYAAYPGETRIIDGSGIALPDDLVGLFYILNKSYITVSGLRVINAGPNDNNAAILVDGSSYIILGNNTDCAD